METGLASVLVLNWDRKDDLIDCIESLTKQTYTNTEIIIVDNGSSDGSQDAVRKKYPEVKLIENEKNLGFAKGNNIGIKKAKGEFILTLNNDIQADKDWVKELVETAKSSQDIGMCASKMKLYYEQDKIDSTGIVGGVTGASYDRGFGEKDDGQYDEPEEVFGPCAGAALYKKKMLEDIKLDKQYFDEDYFAYNEDSDLAWRARLRGWKCMYEPKAIVYHKHSATWGETSPWKIYYMRRNSLKNFIKNSSTQKLLIYTPFIIAYNLAVIPYYVKIKRLTPYINALKDNITDLFKTLRKRKIIQTTRKKNPKEVEQWLKLENPLSTYLRAIKARKNEDIVRENDNINK